MFDNGSTCPYAWVSYALHDGKPGEIVWVMPLHLTGHGKHAMILSEAIQHEYVGTGHFVLINGTVDFFNCSALFRLEGRD